MDAGAEVFDYGNSIRGEAQLAGYERAFAFPGFVPAYIRPLFCEGKGPFRWAALSGDPADIAVTDRAVLDLFPDNEPLERWIRSAQEKVAFQGLPARICWLGYGERHLAGLRFNELVARGEISAPIVIGRDHLDAGSVASPYRETEAMADGSDAIADWPLAERAGQHGLGCVVGIDPPRWRRGHRSVDSCGAGKRRRRNAVCRAEARAGADQRPRHGCDPARRRWLRARERGCGATRRPDSDARIRSRVSVPVRGNAVAAGIVARSTSYGRSCCRLAVRCGRLSQVRLERRGSPGAVVVRFGRGRSRPRRAGRSQRQPVGVVVAAGWSGEPRDAFVSGSHLDSVPDGGAFDGPLGVVSALCAIDLLRSRGVQPLRPVAVVVFADEEGARFGVACAGSRLATGALEPDAARALTDVDGVSLDEAMRRAGVGTANLGRDDEALRRVGVFVELHIEQGRALVDLDAPVAIGTSIWPHGRWRFSFEGRRTTPGRRE